MCLHKMADRLYVRLQEECDRHISDELAALAASQTIDPVLFLPQVIHAMPGSQLSGASWGQGNSK